PVTIAHDPVYKKVRGAGGGVTEYTFNIRTPRADGSGGLRLDADAYCKIFNGQITNWNDPALKALNGGKSLKDPDDPTSAASWSVPMQIVGRLDSSGTTSLWTRHIAAVCGGLAGNAYADSTSTLPASLQGPVYDKTQANTTVSEVAGKYVLADGNGGVAKYVDFTQAPGANAGDEVTQGRIAYLGPDYTLPSVTSVGGAAAAYNLVTATLKNSSGAWVAPSGTAARISYGAILPPDSNANGTYDAGSSDVRDRANPQDWVEPASKTSALANPTAAKGYPIVGTSNFLAYNCYASAGSVKVVTGFLQWYNSSGVVTDANLGILAKSGFSALPPAWRTAIKETFVKNGSGLGLNISKAGSGGCTNGEVGG
ncbi:MAG: substrate-binding domain-containing protein, partial [Caulobacteraceae bacterium]